MLLLQWLFFFVIVFQRTKFIVEEPEFNTTKVKLPIVRNGGTLGAVTIQWVATLNGQLASHDLQLALGEVKFTPGQTIHTLQLELLADDFPEIEEVKKMDLMSDPMNDVLIL